MKKWLESKGIYDATFGLDWNPRHWLWFYLTDWYDGQLHIIRIGPLYFYWTT